MASPAESATHRLSSVLSSASADKLILSKEGFFDVTDSGHAAPPVRTIAQRAMRTRAYAGIYQTIRPLGRRILGGVHGPGRNADRGHIADHLRLGSGSIVLDVGCGPGNFTGWFGEQVGHSGLAVGVDASVQMLTQAVRDNSGGSVVYLRGDAERLPFVDDSVDSVACLAALYLINDPRAALREMLRVVRPSGRIVILTSLGPGNQRVRDLLGAVSGATFFGADEVTSTLSELGAKIVAHHKQGIAQTVVATKRLPAE